jgi:hypothetical protein
VTRVNFRGDKFKEAKLSEGLVMGCYPQEHLTNRIPCKKN